jgi:protein SCO1
MMDQSANADQTTHAAGRQVILTLSASFLVVLLGLSALYRATEGGVSFTTETYRRIQVEKQAQDIPALRIVDQSNEKTDLNSFFKSSNKVWIVDFIYTRCQTVCLALGSKYQQLQTQIQQRGLGGKIGLLSVSFDPTNDTPAALMRYAQRLQANPAVWKIVTLENVNDKHKLLSEFGIMVIPAPLGEFEHNAAFHLVDSQARLVKIIGYEQTDQLLDLTLALLKQ